MATLDQIAFSMISAAGDAQSLHLDAIHAAKNGDFAKADKLMNEAEQLLLTAHQQQTKLIKDEADNAKPEISVLLIHAQDHLMNGVLSKKLVKEMIDMYREIKK